MNPLVRWAATMLLALGLVGCGERERIFPTDPTDAAGFTERGWESFSSGNFDSALSDFAEALALDPTFAEAHLGTGWSQLGGAITVGAMSEAVTSFDDAVADGLDTAELRAGRAAALLGAGRGSDARADVAAARSQDSSFVFSRKSSFDAKDLALIEVASFAADGDLSSALTAAEQIESSGLDPGNSSSWTVNGTPFSSYEGAVLAFLEKLSEEHAG